jgi:hypothetical protein
LFDEARNAVALVLGGEVRKTDGVAGPIVRRQRPPPSPVQYTNNDGAVMSC